MDQRFPLITLGTISDPEKVPGAFISLFREVQKTQRAATLLQVAVELEAVLRSDDARYRPSHALQRLEALLLEWRALAGEPQQPGAAA